MVVDIISYIVIAGVFLGGMIPLVAGIISYAKENKKLDRQKHTQSGSSLL
jgi:succinate-acetate transporter protein